MNRQRTNLSNQPPQSTNIEKTGSLTTPGFFIDSPLHPTYANAEQKQSPAHFDGTSLSARATFISPSASLRLGAIIVT